MRSLAVFLLLTGMASAGEVDALRAQELRNLVQQDCGSCHGLTRKGGLGPDIRTQTLEEREASGLAEIIKYGIPTTAMPPWGPLLSDSEISWIVEYLLENPDE